MQSHEHIVYEVHSCCPLNGSHTVLQISGGVSIGYGIAKCYQCSRFQKNINLFLGIQTKEKFWQPKLDCLLVQYHWFTEFVDLSTLTRPATQLASARKTERNWKHIFIHITAKL